MSRRPLIIFHPTSSYTSKFASPAARLRMADGTQPRKSRKSQGCRSSSSTSSDDERERRKADKRKRKSARKDRRHEEAAAAPREPLWPRVTFRLVDKINSYNDDCENRLQWIEIRGRRPKDAPDTVVDMAEFARLTEFARTTFDIDPELQIALRPQLPGWTPVRFYQGPEKRV